MSEIGQAFIAQSRYHLVEHYLPKIERCLRLLTDEQIWWRANSESNSIGNLLLHLSGNVRQWIVSGVGNQLDERDRDSEFAQREVISGDALLRRLTTTLKEADAVLKDFEPSRLLEMRQIQGLNVSALEAILHVVEHFSMHTGQIIMLTKDLTARDLQFYEFEEGAAARRW
jgi:uncharacterized damage-inducible protein DinB